MKVAAKLVISKPPTRLYKRNQLYINIQKDNVNGFKWTLVIKNISDYCVLDSQFDVSKKFEIKEVINDFDVAAKSKCEVFTDKALDFNLRIKK